MFCPECGVQLTGNDKFCANCGAPVSIETDPSVSVESSNTRLSLQDEPKPAPTDKASSATLDSKVEPKVSPAASSGLLKKYIPAIVGVLAIVAIVAFFGVNALGGGPLGQTSDKFKEGFVVSKLAMNGVVSNEFLNTSAYEVTEYTCGKLRKEGDGIVIADIEATIENDNFSTHLVGEEIYFESSKGNNTQSSVRYAPGYNFNIQTATTTPKKGIDFDEKNGLSGLTSTLSEDKRTCSVTKEDKYSFWFADVVHESEYHYEFDGKQWKYKDMTPHDIFNYKDVSGTYKAKVGDIADVTEITISDFDETKGTFIVDSSTVLTLPVSYTSFDRIEKTVTGTCNSVISLEDGTWSPYIQEDGYVYYFQGSGTSSDGNGQSSIQGYFTTSKSGEFTIEIKRLELDYTRVSTNNTTGIYGTFFKQE